MNSNVENKATHSDREEANRERRESLDTPGRGQNKHYDMENEAMQRSGNGKISWKTETREPRDENKSKQTEGRRSTGGERSEKRKQTKGVRGEDAP